MWEISFCIFVCSLIIWFIPWRYRSRTTHSKPYSDPEFHKIISDPIVYYIVTRMLREPLISDASTTEGKRRARKYNLLRARLDSAVGDKEALKRINQFIERKRNN